MATPSMAGPVHDLLLTYHPTSHITVKAFFWSMNPSSEHLVLSVPILLTQFWSFQNFFRTGWSMFYFCSHNWQNPEQYIADRRSWMNVQGFECPFLLTSLKTIFHIFQFLSAIIVTCLKVIIEHVLVLNTWQKIAMSSKVPFCCI